ncbi:right-handed parallel beta-helix repeat-containing protein [Clostridium vitabionis]|uniref:hypothetical protein n=1 Tax=Clostridium vitabionis TaxID=2784388 RepID=UPI00188D66F0|nr:hypothetical protein [Clostridium vitabionis]
MRKCRHRIAAAVSAAVFALMSSLGGSSSMQSLADTGAFTKQDTEKYSGGIASEIPLPYATPAEIGEEGKTAEKEASEGSLAKPEIPLVNDLPANEHAAETPAAISGAEMPAVDFDPVVFGDGSRVVVSAPEGAFPAGVSLSVTRVMSDQILDALKTASGTDNLSEENAAAYDFDFYTEAEDHLEPQQEISVRFENLGLAGASRPEVYHLPDEDADDADRFAAKTDEGADGKISAEISTAEFSIYAVLRAPADETGRFWINDASDKTYTKLQEAVIAASVGDTVHMKGRFDAEAVSGAAVDREITLEAAGNTSIEGGDNKNGFILKSGSTIRTADGATFTMSGFNTALTVEDGAAINDGSYVFDNVGKGLVLKGKLEGTDREKLKVSIAAKQGAEGFDTGAAATIKKATLDWKGGHYDGYTSRNLTADDADIEIDDVWLQANPIHVSNSYFKLSGRFNKDSWKGGLVLILTNNDATFINSTFVIEQSRVTIAGGRVLTFKNTDVTVKNSPDGGFNVNDGATLAVHDSVIRAENVSRFPLIGVGIFETAHLVFDGSSRVETQAKSSMDSVGAMDGTYVVTGGSYRVYEESLSNAGAIPTNGADNGDEKLTLFTLADSSVTELHPVNCLGKKYTYPVKDANEDGKKHVWCPKVTVTYRLNNSRAVYANEPQKGDRTFETIRGYSLSAVEGFTDPGTPRDPSGKEFQGWYYQDSTGKEQPFDPQKTRLTADTEVYARWAGKMVIYHNGGGVNAIRQLDEAGTSFPADSYEQISGDEPNFPVAGKIFRFWTRDAAGTGTPIQPGDQISFGSGETKVELYAQYDDLQYSVSFSANGGKFSQNSIYHDAKYFTISKDANGGEVATLNRKATYGKQLQDILGELNHNQLKLSADIASMPGFKLKSSTDWYKDQAGSEPIRFVDYSWWSGENPVITSDVTYYLGWECRLDPVDNKGTIDADLWNGDPSDEAGSEDITPVQTGDAISLTGAVDVSNIKSQITALADRYKIDETGYKNIQIIHPQSEFTAVLALPENVEIPQSADQLNASAEGLGDCFTLDPKIVLDQSKRTVTVSFLLKEGVTNFQTLFDRVNRTGVQANLTNGASDTILITVGGFAVGSGQSGSQFTVTGTVHGNFSAVASMGAQEGQGADLPAEAPQNMQYFTFEWNGVQSSQGKDKGSKQGITATYRIYEPVHLELPGDITTVDPSASQDAHADSRAVRAVFPGETLDYVGRLDISSIQEQIKGIWEDYGKSGTADQEDIATNKVRSFFTAEITFPKGLTVSALNKDSVGFTENDLFEVTDVTADKEKNAVRVVMGLRKTYQNFADLYRDVTGVPPILEVTIPGITVDQETLGDTVLTAVGTVTGDFYGEAVKTDSGAAVPALRMLDAFSEKPAQQDSKAKKVFAFAWNAVQGLDGKDDHQAKEDERTIAYSVKTAARLTLPGDLLINGDTCHDSVYPAKTGEELAYRAELDVAGIQEQMRAVEGSFAVSQDRYGDISLNGLASEFTAVFQIPKELAAVWPAKIGEYQLEGTGAYNISSVEKSGTTVTVRMTLREGITTYEELRRAVLNDTNSTLALEVSSFAVPDSLAEKTMYTVTGTLGGMMKASAVLNGKTRSFAFSWEAEQRKDPDGTDAILPSDDRTISVTAEILRQSTPDQPVTPDNPPDPHHSGGSGGGGGSHSGGSFRPGAVVPPENEDVPGIVHGGSEGDNTFSTSQQAGDLEPAKGSAPSRLLRRIVKTGDSTPILLYLAVILASGGLLAVYVMRRRKK